MNLFKDSVWKWWQLKLIAWAGLLLGLILGIYWGQYLTDWLWLIWSLLVIVYLYLITIWLKK